MPTASATLLHVTRLGPRGGPSTTVVGSPSPSVVKGFEECGEYLIEDRSRSFDALVVDDEPLARTPNATAHGAWTWSPGFFAGEVRVEARAGERTLATFRFDVSPDPRKLGGELFAAMVDEIWDEDPELVLGSEPATRAIGRSGAVRNPLLEFERLRRHVPLFVRALLAVAERPRRRLVVERVLVPANRVRRVDRTTVRAALRHAATRAFVIGREEHHAPIGVLRAVASEARFDVPRVEEDLDSAANRALAALVRQVLARVCSVRERLARQSLAASNDEDTRTSLARRWPERLRLLDEFEVALRRRLAATPLTHVSRTEVTAAGLVALDTDPLYGRASTLARRALRRGIAETSDERHWLSPTFDLFERWCFVRLARDLRRRHVHLAWSRIPPHRGPARATAGWRAVDGEHSLEFLFQPRFPSRPHGRADGPSSISATRIPDMALVEHANGSTRFALFDAKYRGDRRNLLDAMTSAHIYRDALRWSNTRADHVTLVVPSAAGAAPLATDEYHAAHGCGLRELQPGSASFTFDAWASNW